MTVRARLPVFVAGLCALAGSTARGDEVVAGAQRLQRAEITGLARGAIDLRTEDGRTVRIPLWTVEHLLVDTASGLEDLNAAEDYIRKNDPAEAVKRYERAVRGGRAFWPDLVRARLVQAADRAGQHEKAGNALLELVRADAAAAAAVLPANLPGKRDKSVDRLAGKLDQALTSEADGPARTVVALYRYALGLALGEPAYAQAAADLATTLLPEELCTPRAVTVQLAAMDAVLEAGGKQPIAAAVEQLLALAPAELLPGVLLTKSRALLAAARSPDDFLVAALPALRVVIHYPQDRQAGAALLLAAEAHARAGRTADAGRLWREVLARDNVDEANKERARQALAKLNEARGPA